MQCVECGRSSETEIAMIDEVEEAATEHDFHASGAINRLEFACDCGCEACTITKIGYVMQPIDLLRPDGHA